LANYKTYTECVEGGLKHGSRSADMNWFCSSLGFKN
jgi:hypothetical protein